ncbi:MAG: CheR family methyltransferase, partial [Myxococcota bacterium]
HELLVGVTEFFRDGEPFETLGGDILPELIDRLEPTEELRIWVCACGTGEEAFTVAMLAHEAFRAIGEEPRVRIIASDVNQAALDHADAAVYPKAALEPVPEELRARYFMGTSAGQRVIDDVRQSVVFVRHHALEGAPFAKLHLVCCRNLLIYLRRPAQRRLLSLLLFGLRTGGALMLGKSERSVAQLDALRPHDASSGIFWKRSDGPDRSVRRRRMHRKQAPVVWPASRATEAPTSLADTPPTLLAAYDALLAAHIPAGLLLDHELNLIHVFGDASRFLEVQPGRHTSDLTRLLQPIYRGVVKDVVRRIRASSEGAPPPPELTVDPGGASSPVHVSGRRLAIPGDHTFFFVSLSTAAPPAAEADPKNGDGRPVASSLRDADGDPNSAARPGDDTVLLRAELQQARERLAATVAKLEASNEGMQVTNVELVAANEELRSTNEELQSVNDELQVVNAELEDKVSAVAEITADVESLLKSMEVGTIHLDDDLCIVRFTPLAAAKFHFKTRDVGRNIDDFNTQFDVPTLVGDLQRVIAEGCTVEREVQDDHDRWYLLRFLPYRSRGVDAGAVITIIDVDALKDAQQSARREVERRDEFLAVLSHELRTPLSAILNATQVASSEPSRASEVLAVIRRQSEHLAELLRDLLDVSRISSGKLKVQLRPVSLVEIVVGAAEAARPAVEARRLTLRVNRPDGPVVVNGDGLRLRQVVNNLLDNATKYNREGGRIDVHIRTEGSDARLTVTDTGIGIEPSDAAKMFEPFVQNRRGASRDEGGMGIGLAVVRHVIELHAGTVTAHSEGPGRGSEISVTLPLAQGDVALDEPDPPPKEVQDSAVILLVEDDEDAREMSELLLSRAGFTVTTASSVPAALDAYQNQRPDVVITDVGLPGRSGLELVRELRHRAGPSLVIIVMSGYGRPADETAAKKAGADRHLVKPVTI